MRRGRGWSCVANSDHSRLPHKIEQVLPRASDMFDRGPRGPIGVAGGNRINDFAVLGGSLAQA